MYPDKYGNWLTPPSPPGPPPTCRVGDPHSRGKCISQYEYSTYMHKGAYQDTNPAPRCRVERTTFFNGREWHSE